MLDITDIKARYSRTESAKDAFGRIIVVGRIKPSQQARVVDLAGDNTSNLFRIVACVRKIDDDDIPFPKTRAEVEALMDRLDNEGMDAAGEALSKLVGTGADASTSPVADAKN